MNLPYGVAVLDLRRQPFPAPFHLPQGVPYMSHPTHEGLAIRFCDIRAGLVPGINPLPAAERHPDSEKPLGYDQAIDDDTGLNWMDGPTVTYVPGTTPRYEFIQPVSAAGGPAGVPADLVELGYRAGEWYAVPEGTVKLPEVWDGLDEPVSSGETSSAVRPLAIGDEVMWHTADHNFRPMKIAELRVVEYPHGEWNMDPELFVRVEGSDVFRRATDLGRVA